MRRAPLLRATALAVLVLAALAPAAPAGAALHWPFGHAARKQAHAPAPAVHAWVTTSDRSLLLARLPDLPLRAADPAAAGAAEGPVLRIDPQQRFQSYLGVGAAMTDASAVAINKSLDAKQRRELLRELFSDAADHPPGLGLGFMRVPIGGSDFSQLHYSLDDVERGGSDPSLARFLLDPFQVGQVPLLREAKRINPGLLLMASPWSAPAWMKDNDSLVGGHLKARWHDAFADYLVRFAAEYAKAGLPLYALSIQNEPGYETPDYPGMVVTPAERARFVAESLGPRLAKMPNAPLLLDHDHNWDEPQSPARVLGDPAAAKYVAGVAWHCYKGHVAAQSKVHEQFPSFDAYLTECSGGGWQKGWQDAMNGFYGEVVIGGFTHWARAVALWNLALDETHGPHAGGCRNCRGVVTIDAHGHVTRNVEYYALAHVTRCLRPGARRVASSGGPDDVATVAFRNEDDGSLVLLAWNNTAQPRRLAVQAAGHRFDYPLGAGTAATFCWKP